MTELKLIHSATKDLILYEHPESINLQHVKAEWHNLMIRLQFFQHDSETKC